jgi:hypothetical protein
MCSRKYFESAWRLAALVEPRIELTPMKYSEQVRLRVRCVSSVEQVALKWE